MTDLKAGRAWSDERRKLRIKLRSAIDRLTEGAPSDVLTADEIVETVLEAAVGHFVWGDEACGAARHIERLARRIRAGDRLEF